VTKYITKKNMLLKEASVKKEETRVKAIMATMDSKFRKEISFARHNMDNITTVKDLLEVARLVEEKFSENESVNITKSNDTKELRGVKRRKRSSSVDENRKDGDKVPLSCASRN